MGLVTFPKRSEPPPGLAVSLQGRKTCRQRLDPSLATPKLAVFGLGRVEDRKRNDGIAAMLRAGSSYLQVQDAFKCSSSTVARIKKRIDAKQSAEAS